MEFVQRHLPVIVSVACCLVLVTTAYLLGSIFVPLLISFILAYLMEPMVDKLARRGINRSLAIVVIFLLVIVGMVVIIAFLYLRLRDEVAAVQINLPAYANRLYDAIPQDVKIRLDIETPEKVYRHANMALSEMRSGALEIGRETFGLLSKAFVSTLGVVLAFVGYLITPVYLYYLLKDLPEIKAKFVSLVPSRYHEILQAKMQEIDDVLGAFVRGQLLVCVFLAVMYSIGFFFIGIDLGVFIGIISGLAFIIPYVGTVLAMVLSMAMAALKYHDILHPVLCLGWICIVQAMEGGIVTPRIVGDKVGIHPVVAILALLVGGQLFGILGMLLAIPCVAVLKVLLVSVRDRYLGSAYYGGSL